MFIDHNFTSLHSTDNNQVLLSP